MVDGSALCIALNILSYSAAVGGITCGIVILFNNPILLSSRVLIDSIALLRDWRPAGSPLPNAWTAISIPLITLLSTLTPFSKSFAFSTNELRALDASVIPWEFLASSNKSAIGPPPPNILPNIPKSEGLPRPESADLIDSIPVAVAAIVPGSILDSFWIDSVCALSTAICASASALASPLTAFTTVAIPSATEVITPDILSPIAITTPSTPLRTSLTPAPTDLIPRPIFSNPPEIASITPTNTMPTLSITKPTPSNAGPAILNAAANPMNARVISPRPIAVAGFANAATPFAIPMRTNWITFPIPLPSGMSALPSAANPNARPLSAAPAPLPIAFMNAPIPLPRLAIPFPNLPMPPPPEPPSPPPSPPAPPPPIVFRAIVSNRLICEVFQASCEALSWSASALVGWSPLWSSICSATNSRPAVTSPMAPDTSKDCIVLDKFSNAIPTLPEKAASIALAASVKELIFFSSSSLAFSSSSLAFALSAAAASSVALSASARIISLSIVSSKFCARRAWIILSASSAPNISLVSSSCCSWSSFAFFALSNSFFLCFSRFLSCLNSCLLSPASFRCLRCSSLSKKKLSASLLSPLPRMICSSFCKPSCFFSKIVRNPTFASKPTVACLRALVASRKFSNASSSEEAILLLLTHVCGHTHVSTHHTGHADVEQCRQVT